MIRWSPDTCYCIILAPAPSKEGKFEKRCRIHQNSRSTLDVYAHNLANRITSNETGTDAKREAGRKRKDELRETTRQ